MAEIKTCEQYVLNRLMEEEDRNIDLEEQLRQVTSDFNHLEEDMNAFLRVLRNKATLRTLEREDGSKSHYINLESVWETYDPEEYEIVSRILELPDEEEEKEEEE